MDYIDLIKNWHIKASNDDYFSKFIFEYLAFIAYLRKQKYTESTNDRKALQRLKQDEDIKGQYLNNISADTKKSWQILKDEFDRIPLGNASGLNGIEELKWWNCRHDELSQQTEEEKQKLKGVFHSLRDWENMVEFWRAVRDNLFHGSKSPENNRDKLVVEHAYKTLKPLVDVFLEKSGE